MLPSPIKTSNGLTAEILICETLLGPTKLAMMVHGFLHRPQLCPRQKDQMSCRGLRDSRNRRIRGQKVANVIAHLYAAVPHRKGKVYRGLLLLRN